MENSKKKKKRFLKKGALILLFNILLTFIFLVFIIIFIILYFKNNNLYNNKDLLYKYLINNNDDSLIYDNDEYYYQGSVDNYLNINGMIFRIIKINKVGNIDIILNNNYNYLLMDNEYKDSNIKDILNEEIFKYVDKDLFDYTTICFDDNDEDHLYCKDKDYSSYVRLLNSNEYINSFDSDGVSYIGNSAIWSQTIIDSNKLILKDGKIYNAQDNYYYGVRPILTLKNTTKYISGDGSLDNPYIIQKNDKYEIGSYVKIDNDMWLILNNNDNNKLTLVYDGVIANKFSKFSDSSSMYSIKEEDNIGYYLNNDYYNSLSYKDLLVKSEFNISNYNSSEKVEAYVGMLSLYDYLGLIQDDNNYYLITYNNDLVFYYLDGVNSAKSNYLRKIKPVIVINKDNSITGSGSIVDPYVVGVK